jgi:terminase large subunit-like protein
MAFREQLLLEGGVALGDVMEPWQREDFSAMDAPGVQNVYLERPRGHDKTGTAGTEALVEMFLGPEDATLLIVAGDVDQAAICFSDVVGKLRRRPDLLAQVKITEGGKALSIRHKTRGTTLTVLSSDVRTSWGLRPDWINFDELGEQRNRLLWDSIWSATGKRPHCRVLVTSTAGWDRTSLAWEVRSFAATEANWLLSSRGQCASWIAPEWLAQQQRTLPAHVFARLHENRWVENVGAFLTVPEVDTVFANIPEAGSGRYAIGLDLGLTKDASVACLMRATSTGLLVAEQFLTYRPAPGGGKVDLLAVEADVEELARQHHAAIILDPYQGVRLAQGYRARGLVAVEHDITASSRRGLFADMLDLIRKGQLRSLPHEDFRRELLSVEVTQTATGWRADHRKGAHDDHLFAAMLAAHHLRARRPAPLTIEEEEARRPEGSAYEQRAALTALEALILANYPDDGPQRIANAKIAMRNASRDGIFDVMIYEAELLEHLPGLLRLERAGLGHAYDLRTGRTI